MRIDRRCDAFIRRLDRMDPDVAGDPHPRECPACALEMRLALEMREALEAGRGADPADVPSSFAGRTAYIAAAEHEDARRCGWGERLLSAPAFTVTAVLTALAVALQETVPALAGRIHLGIASYVPTFAIRGDVLAVAIPILACVAIGALAGIRLTRRVI